MLGESKSVDNSEALGNLRTINKFIEATFKVCQTYSTTKNRYIQALKSQGDDKVDKLLGELSDEDDLFKKLTNNTKILEDLTTGVDLKAHKLDKELVDELTESSRKLIKQLLVLLASQGNFEPLKYKIYKLIDDIDKKLPTFLAQKKDYSNYLSNMDLTESEPSNSKNPESTSMGDLSEVTAKADSYASFNPYATDMLDTYDTNLLKSDERGMDNEFSMESEDESDEEYLSRTFEQNKIYMRTMKTFSLVKDYNAQKEEKGHISKSKTVESETDQINFDSSEEEEADIESNDEFINFEDQDINSLETLIKVSDSFHTIAATYAKMIIAEKHLSLKDKKIKPLEGQGGIAGGTKFVIHDMFFKFPEDKKLSNTWLYGNFKQNDRIAGKATNHELKGLAHLMNADEKKIFNYPLIVLIDYQGYRQTILIKLPISDESLIYGSDNAGASVHCSKDIHSYLLEISPKLNLKEHLVKDTKEKMVLCTDIEVHQLGEQKDLYVLDFARILPPTFPLSSGNSIFYRLMRSELLEQIHFPISSDAFSLFQNEKEANQLNSEAQKATDILFKMIENRFSSYEALSTFITKEDIAYAKEAKPQYSSLQAKDHITRKLHQNGINFRYFGKIILHVKKIIPLEEKHKIEIDEYVDFFFSMMTIRILKNIWRKKIQEKPKEDVHYFCLKTTVDLINQLSNNSHAITGEAMAMLNEMFADGILVLEERDLLNKEFSIFFKDIKDPHFIILRFTQICGIEPNKAVISSLLRRYEIFFTEADIHNFVSILKPPPVVSYLNALYFICSSKKNNLNVSSKIQFLTQAITFIEYTLGFNFKTNFLRKLHNFVSLEILKYNRKHTVHWSNIYNALQHHTKEFEKFVGLPAKLIRLWRFLQSPVRNILEQPKQKLDQVILSKFLGEFIGLFENLGYTFLKECFEYFFEKEQYHHLQLNKEYDQDKRKSDWNTFLQAISIPNFIQKLESEMKQLSFSLYDIQYWDIDYQKKEILLFLNKYYFIDSLDKPSMHYVDKFTKNSLFGKNPISKSLLFEYFVNSSKTSISKRDLVQKLFLSNFEKNIKDELLERNIAYSKDNAYSVYFLLFPKDVGKKYLKKFPYLLEEENRSYNSTSGYDRTAYSLVNKSFSCYGEDIIFYCSDCGTIEIQSVIENLSLNDPVIYTLECYGNTFGDEGVQSMAEYLKSNTTIKSINLSINRIGNKGAQIISELLKSNSTITSINLSGNEIGNEGIQFLSESLKSNTTLTSINLSDNKVDIAGAHLMLDCLRVNSTISTLNITSPHYPDYINEAVSVITQKKPLLEISDRRIGKAESQFIAECLRSSTTITTVNLPCNEIGSEGAPFIAESLMSNSTITYVDLRGNKLSKGAQFMAESLKRNSSITSINLSENQIGNEGAQFIGESLKSNSKITSINLSNNELELSGVKFISDGLKSNSTITDIDLSNNQIKNEASQFISEALKSNSTITKMNLSKNQIEKEGAQFIAQALKTNNSNISIDLSSNQIGNEGIQFISEALKSNSTMTSINLSTNEIDTAGALSFVECLKSNSTITSINLSNNQIGDEGAKQLILCLKPNIISLELSSNPISQYLLHIISALTKDRDIYIDLSRELSEEGVQFISVWLKVNSTITSLRLASAYISNRGAQYLAESLRSDSTIQAIDLSYNEIEDEGAQFLSECLKVNSTLTSINLYNNKIGTDGAKFISESLKSNSTLKSINLAGNKIGNKGAQFFFESLRSNSSITYINLAGNGIGNETQFITESLKSNSTIKSIDISENQIEKEGIQNIIEYLKSNSIITTINISKNEIGNEGAKMISDCLRSNSTITSINISGIQMGNEGAQFISDCLKLNSTVRSIDLSYNKIDEQGALFISEFLKSNSTITSINLSDNAIEAKGALSILETLNTFPTAITSIDVSCNPINPYVSQLFPILLEKQTTIQFPRSYLGDPAVAYISQFLKSNSTVTTVDIRNNQVGPEGAGYIAECLKSNSTLTSINLRDNRIKHEGALVILHALKSNTTLKSIDLNWNSIDSSAFQLAVDAQYSGRDNIPSISF